jgi:hypothetical protein
MATNAEKKQYLADNLDNQDSAEFKAVLASLQEGGGVTKLSAALEGSKIGTFVQGVADFPLGFIQEMSEQIGTDIDNNFITQFIHRQKSGESTEGKTFEEYVAGGGEAGRGEGNKFTQELRRREERIARAREAVGNKGFDWTRLAGTLATGVGVTKGIGVVEGFLKKLLQGGVVGGEFGQTSIATSDDISKQKVGQNLTGIGFGALIPGVAGGAKYVGQKSGQLLDIMGPNGARSNARRVLLDAAGKRTDEIIDLLENYDTPLGGGNAGQVAAKAGSAEFSGVQQLASGSNPSSQIARQAADNLRRTQALDSIAGTGDDMINAIKFRLGNSAPMYEEAFNAQLDDVIMSSKAFGNKVSTRATTELNKLISDPIYSEGNARSNGNSQISRCCVRNYSILSFD